jgi:hypothetical protein
MTTVAMREGLSTAFERMTDFIFAESYVERTVIKELKKGSYYLLYGSFPSNPTRKYEFTSYLVTVVTSRGTVQMGVDRRTFEHLRVDDPIVVEYRVGRWTGKLRADIAQ